MQRLEQLIAQARLPDAIDTISAVDEGSRLMTICNACRYCEGFCAVFPAMTRRLEFGTADIHYLANLCHNCGACLHACQYAPPHAFAVNVPRTFARVRMTTYSEYAWPRAFAGLYRRNGLTVAVALAASLALFLLLVVFRGGVVQPQSNPANFYAVFPHGVMVWMFAPPFVFAIIALAIGVRRFWRDTAGRKGEVIVKPAAFLEATSDILRLKYLDGGHGQGCNEADDAFTLSRRRFHHLTFYGFILCFSATCVATLYHYALGQPAPYALTSLPVLLGITGGLGLIAGPLGLLWLNLRRAPQHGDQSQYPMDRAFILLLLLSSLTGLALLGWRATPWMPALLAIHLGVILALFVTLPYGKFAHGIYRSAALLQNAIEKRRPRGRAIADG